LSYFIDSVSCFCPELALDFDSPTYAFLRSWNCSCVAPWLTCWFGWDLTQCLPRPWTVILQISTSLVAGITEV
jgi:hypothetical protein